MVSISLELIAPCGMNCALCAGYLSMKNNLKLKGIPITACKGCRTGGRECAYIKKWCPKILKEVNFCYECSDFPCHRVKTLDKRYSSRYHMSPVENLQFIKTKGIQRFLEWQQQKWQCPNCGEMISCHNGICFNCDQERLRGKKHAYRWEDSEDPKPAKKSTASTDCDLLKQLAAKSISKDTLYAEVTKDFALIPVLLQGISSPRASVRYGCAKILNDLSANYPEKLYPFIDDFFTLLDSKYRILTWNALAIIANLSRVDTEKKFDGKFDKYYSFLHDDYLVTVANVVGFSNKIALAKQYLIPRITAKLLEVEAHETTPHLTEECKRVLAEKTLETFNAFFTQLAAKDKPKVLTFAKRQQDSPRKGLQLKASAFLKRWSPPRHDT